MKMRKECVDCFRKQARKTVGLTGCSPEKTEIIGRQVEKELTHFDFNLSPPENAIGFYGMLADLTACDDPYLQIKRRSNLQAKEMLPFARKSIEHADDRFLAILKYTIAGNIIDYGALDEHEMKGAVEKCLEAPLEIDCSELLLSRIEKLGSEHSIVYLLDNCGEIVYDILFLEYLKETGATITLVTRGGPIINDAQKRDALEVGLDRYGGVIDNGVSCPGTPFDRCSEEVKVLMTDADLIISKGQGNFETLSDFEGNIVFLLTVKCGCVADYITEMVGKGSQKLFGRGELVVFCRD